MDEWMACMRRGDFAGAWAVSDRIARARDGTPVNGRRVLVRCYHGLGDTIQFVRFLPQLRARAAGTILWAQPALLPLLGSAAGVDELRALHESEPGVAGTWTSS